MSRSDIGRVGLQDFVQLLQDFGKAKEGAKSEGQAGGCPMKGGLDICA